MTPLADGDHVDAEPGGDDLVLEALGAGQDDPGPLGQALGALGPGGPGFEFLPLVVAEGERGFGTTTFAHHVSPFQESMMRSPIAQGYLADF